MPRGEGNGQGNFTRKRNPKALKEIMNFEIKARKTKKRRLSAEKFLSFRESTKLNPSKI